MKLPTDSRDNLQAYALERAANVRWGCSSHSEVGQNQNYFDVRITGGGSAILSVLNSKGFRFGVENVNDKVHLWASVTDIDGHELIRGNETKNLVRKASGDYRPEDKNIKLYYSDTIPVSTPNFNYVYALIRDSDGETISRDEIQVVNGKMMFPVALAGIASLQVYAGEKNTEYLYSPEGKLIAPEQVTSDGLSATIDNTFILKDANLDTVLIKSEGGHGKNLLFELTLTKTTDVEFSAMTSEGFYNNGLAIKKAGGEVNSWPVPKGYVVSHKLPPGRYYIWFLWDPKEFDEYPLQYNPPPAIDDGHGKG